MELCYTNNKLVSQDESMFYIFEIEIKGDENIVIRRIKYYKSGELINLNDEIINTISKIKMNIFDLNNPNKKITLKKRFNKVIKNNIILPHSDIIINISSINDNLICSYKFL
jgi:hypothetical protein